MNRKSTNTPGGGYVKTETTIIIAAVAVILGFFGGILFSGYKWGASSANPAMNQAVREQHAMVRALEKRVSDNPKDVTAWITLGNLFFDAENYSKSINAYEKALSIEPGRADVLTDLGVMYRRNREPEKAIGAFNKAIEADPGHEAARFNKGVIYLHDMNDKTKAIEVWEELLAMNPFYMAPNGQTLDEFIRHYQEHVDH